MHNGLVFENLTQSPRFEKKNEKDGEKPVFLFLNFRTRRIDCLDSSMVASMHPKQKRMYKLRMFFLFIMTPLGRLFQKFSNISIKSAIKEGAFL